jgi:3-oxoacyl-[acyl-carrier protein] reductase
LNRLRKRCASVCPGPIDTPLMAQFEAGHDAAAGIRGWYHSQTPAGRYGEADEVADAVAFLLSDQSRFINGSALMIDGGLTASGRPAKRVAASG